jgi:phosphatidylglycerophosphate synthase
MIRKGSDRTENNEQVIKLITSDRERTNLLRNSEQQALAYLVQRIPSWVSSNFLTGIGFAGSIIVFYSFLLATWFDRLWLLVGVGGFAISWFGDSLDGRLAWYRKMPRKRYGFVLDITFDWISIIFIGCGYMVYAEGPWELLGYGFVVMYGWEMIIALMRYKLTDKYSIDTGKLGPTEARIIISAILVLELIVSGSIVWSALVVGIALFIINVIDTRRLLDVANEIDVAEKNGRLAQN